MHLELHPKVLCILPNMANNMMLTKPERERLENRDTLDPAIRARNELIVRTKVLNWFRSSPEVLEILHLLPKKQLDRILDDEFVYSMLFIAERLMNELEFGAVYGAMNAPEDWHVVVKETGKEAREQKIHPVRDIDIKRDILLRFHAGYIHNFLPLSGQDPVWEAYAMLQRTPDERVAFGKRFLQLTSDKDLERLYESIQRVNDAVKRWHK